MQDLEMKEIEQVSGGFAWYGTLQHLDYERAGKEYGFINVYYGGIAVCEGAV